MKSSQRNFYKVYYETITKCAYKIDARQYSLIIRANSADDAKRIIEELAMDNYQCDSVRVYCVEFIRRNKDDKADNIEIN